MVFHQTSIGKRKLANLNESNKTIPNSARRPASGSSNNDSPISNRTAKLKSLANVDFSNKSLKPTLKPSKNQDDLPDQSKTKFQKSNSDRSNSFKVKCTNETYSNGLNKKMNSKQPNQLESKCRQRFAQPQNQPYNFLNDTYNGETFNFESFENYQKQENFYEQRIKSLREQLEKMKSFKKLSTQASLRSSAIKAEISDFKVESGFNHLSKFLHDVAQIERESAENISIVNNWHEKQKSEVELQYNLEHRRAIQEFQDKRKELKENLRNDNEEKRRQVEIDRNLLDINMDISDVKPTTTRKLRRRFNVNPIANLPNSAQANFDYSMDSNSFDIESASHHHNSNSIMSSSAVLLQSSVLCASLINASTVGLVSGSNVAGGCLNGSGSNHYNSIYFGNNVLNNNISSSNNERKRKFGPAALTFTISEDEINEDLKCLS